MAGTDAICLGDAENGFVELLNNWGGRFLINNKNFVVKESDLNNIDYLRVKPAQNLDQFTPDFSYDNYYFLKNGELINLSSELVETPKQHLVGHKQTLFIPHKEVAQIVVIIATTMKSKRRFLGLQEIQFLIFE